VRRFAVSLVLAASVCGAVLAGAGDVWARGSVLVFQRQGRGGVAEIVVASTADGGRRVLVRGSHPLLSPNGKLVAFTRKNGGFFSQPTDELWVVRTAGGRPVHIASPQRAAVAWSADSRLLLLGTGEQEPQQYDVVDLHGRRVGIVPYAFSADTAGFSPDGKLIAIGDDDHTASFLELYSVTGRPEATLGEGDFPVWGCGGLAYLGASPVSGGLGSVYLRSPLSAAPAPILTLLPGQVGASEALHPLACSSDRRTLLLAAFSNDFNTEQAVLLDVRSRRLRLLAAPVSRIDGISTDGSKVLAEATRTVVILARDGRMRVIGTGQNASWNG
jgi:hypothetical protein